jgi:hypothetical protein
MPQVSQWYFKAAVLFLIAGIAMGLQMSITENHNVIGAHAHVNLVGWATSALFGTYFALNAAKAAERLARIQCGIHIAGTVLMAGALYLLLLGNVAMVPVVATASIIVAIGVLIFAYIVFKPD